MFIHLRAHTAYSLLEGAIHPKDLVGLAKQNNMPAVAITDTGNLFGALEFSLTAKDAGIQPIMGCQIQATSPHSERNQETDTLVLLAQNQAGYQNLLKIVSYSFLKGKETGQPQVNFEDLQKWSEGLIALTGGAQGGLAKALEKGLDGKDYLRLLQNLFAGRLYIEIARQGTQSREQRRVEEALLNLAYEQNLPLVATNEVLFADPTFYEAHDAMLCISEGTYIYEAERRRVSPDHCFKSSQEMEKLFADLPEAIANTEVIAKRCSFLLTPIDPILPNFPCEDEIEELRKQARAGLEQRLQHHVFLDSMDDKTKEELRTKYFKQLDYELSVIERMKYSGYFLIVADFIKWAKSQGIPVGPGRGSGAGSVVAWSLTITDLDPLRFGLVFERFLNPERVSMPDFDIDFCQDRRDEVIRYVRDKYGADRVAHIITFGKLQARAVLRDVGRVLQMPYGQVDRICKLIPNNPANPVTIEEALNIEPQLKQMMETEPEVQRLISLGRQLEGLYRHASTHAAGVVIGDRPLDELVPLYYDPRSTLPATQFNMKYVERAGLVKFDFLGLKTLTVIQQTIKYLQDREITLDISSIPLDDEKTFALLRRAETVGVFQVEGTGMTDVLHRLQPEKFDELVALNALYRPGPMDDIPRYIACRHGEEKVTYAYPELKPILEDSYGVIVYQEHVLQIARDLAGYTLAGADLLRRAIGKKIQSEMKAQRKQFTEGILERLGGEESKAKALFDQIEKFASYAFPKAHAAAYALITYQTAYLKAHYPVEFMAALMTHELHNTDKLTYFVREVKRLGIELLPPDINTSGASFVVENGAIRYALAALKNVGIAAMEAVVEERKAKGLFKDIFDFVERMDGRVINKRQMENLIASGALDSLSPHRRQLWDNLDLLLRYGNEDKRPQGLFGAEVIRPILNEVPSWTPLEKLQNELSAVGFYLTSHPLDMYGDSFDRLGVISAAQLSVVTKENREAQTYRLAGVVVTKQEKAGKNGQRYAFVQFSDPTGLFEVVLFSELLSQMREVLNAGESFLVSVSASYSEKALRLTCHSLENLDQAMEGGAMMLSLDSQEHLRSLKEVLEQASPGRTRIYVDLPYAGERVRFELPQAYALTPTQRSFLQDFRQEGLLS